VYEKLASGDITEAEFSEISDLHNSLGKNASISDGAKYVGGGIAAAIGAHVLSGGIQSGMSKLTFNSDIKRMLSVDPDMGRQYSDKEIRLAFSSVRAMNPAASKDPLVASTLVSRILRTRDPSNPRGPMQFDPQLAMGLLKETGKGVDAQSHRILGDAFGKGFHAGMGVGSSDVGQKKR